VLRVPQYVAQAESGSLVPSARPRLLRDNAVTALVDAARGFGHYSTAYALEWAMRQARQHGVAAAAVRHSSHIGRLGEYAERAAAAGLIAMLTVGAAGPGVGGMVLFGGRQRFFGANPWTMAFPVEGAAPVLLDASSSTVAEGKVRLARARGEPLPPGCIIDREGRPSTDPEDFYAGGALSPLGGDVAGHKGYGLAMASALIGSLAMIDDPDYTLIGASVLQETGDRRGQAAGVFLLVLDPARFGDAAAYQAQVRATVDAAKRVPPAPGVGEVLVPGEPEARSRAQRERAGIVLPAATWQELATVGARFGIPLPE
jgi:LDH2 family malate/lactate/ureidoglycolate dehydrogenase